MTILDADELILPRHPSAKTFHELLQSSSLMGSANRTGTCFHELQMVKSDEPLQLLENSATLTDEDKQLLELASTKSSYFLTQIHSVDTKTRNGLWRHKCIHDLDKIVSTTVHSSVSCVGDNNGALGPCKEVRAMGRVGSVYHYRTVCEDKARRRGEIAMLQFPCSGEKLKNFKFAKDTTIWKYKHDLQKALKKMLEGIQL